MNSPTLQGAAALALGAVVFVWVYLIRTNLIRWYRWPLCVIAILSGYTLVSLNAKGVAHARMPADVVTWWENWTLTLVTLLVVLLPAMHVLNERHEKTRAKAPQRRSRAHVQVRHYPTNEPSH